MVNRRVTLAVLVVAPVMLALVVGQVGALTPTVRKHLRDELTVKVEPARLKLCVGEEQSVFITTKRHGVYEDLGGPRSVRRPRPYRLENNLWGGENLRVSGRTGSAVVEIGSDQAGEEVRQGLDHQTRFEVVGRQVGSTTVELVVEQPGAHSARASVDIEVTECDYRVRTVSLWHLDTTGWNTVVGAFMRTEIVHDPSAGAAEGIRTYFPEGDVNAETVAVEFPAFDCDATITEAELRVVVTGGVLPISQKLVILLKFDSVAASKFATCTSRSIPGESQGTGSLDTVEFEFGIGGGHEEAPHILRAAGLGDFTGTTYMTVTPIRR